MWVSARFSEHTRKSFKLGVCVGDMTSLFPLLVYCLRKHSLPAHLYSLHFHIFCQVISIIDYITKQKFVFFYIHRLDIIILCLFGYGNKFYKRNLQKNFPLLICLENLLFPTVALPPFPHSLICFESFEPLSARAIILKLFIIHQFHVI